MLCVGKIQKTKAITMSGSTQIGGRRPFMAGVGDAQGPERFRGPPGNVQKVLQKEMR
jgi:hypothetical protein